MTYTVKKLMEALADMPQESNVLLYLSVFDAIAANEDSWGLPPGQTAGLNCVIDYDAHNIYLVHSTQPDEEARP